MEAWTAEGVGGGGAARAAPKGNGRFLLRQLPRFRRLRELLIVTVRVWWVDCEVSMSNKHCKRYGVRAMWEEVFKKQHGLTIWGKQKLDFPLIMCFCFFITNLNIDAPLKTTFINGHKALRLILCTHSPQDISPPFSPPSEAHQLRPNAAYVPACVHVQNSPV